MCTRLEQPGRSTPGADIPRRGFSLLEVLVVVAMIALLVAILLPAISHARAQSKRVACGSHLRQIAAAWNLYLESSRGRFFQCMNANYNYGGLQGSGDPQFGKDPNQPIPKPLNSFLKLRPVERKGGDVFFCPADTGGETEKPTAFDYYGTSYTTNIFLIGQTQLSILPPDPCKYVMLKLSKRLANLNRSSLYGESKLLLVGDFGWVHTYNLMSPVVIDWHARRHTHNMAYMDGHVDFVRIRKGMHVTARYCTIPFREFQEQIAGNPPCQQEVPCE